MKESILALKSGERYIVPESDYGKAEIWRINNIFLLFSIPTFGGSPVYESTWLALQVDGIVETVNSWT